MNPQPKTPPHSLEAEQSVLGALMLDQRAFDRIVGLIDIHDFYRKEHQIIFQAIVDLSQKSQNYDVLTVVENLKLRQQLADAGAENYLYELVNNTPSAANIVSYATLVREHSVLRQLIHMGTDLLDHAFHLEGKEVKELLDKAEQNIFKISAQQNRGEGPVDIATLLARAAERVDLLFHTEGHVTGLATGFVDFDEKTAGLQAGDLIIIAGRPSMGKTAFAMNIAEHVAMLTAENKAKPVLIFSMEMPAESLALRMLSSLGRIDQHRIRTGKLKDEDWPRFASATNMLTQTKMFIDDTPALSPGEVRSRARKLAREHGGLSLIVIDYLQLMQVYGFREGRVGEVSEISRSLKALAKELHVPVIALSQLNRGLEQRTDKRPVMSDLRESGAIEQDADVILFIYRDEVYNENSPEKGIAEMIIGKQRNGPIGKVKMTFLGQFTRFENYTPSSAMINAPFGATKE